MDTLGALSVEDVESKFNEGNDRKDPVPDPMINVPCGKVIDPVPPQGTATGVAFQAPEEMSPTSVRNGREELTVMGAAEAPLRPWDNALDESSQGNGRREFHGGVHRDVDSIASPGEAATSCQVNEIQLIHPHGHGIPG